MKEKKKGILKKILIGTAITAGIGTVSYFSVKNSQLRKENARIRGENEELRRNSEVLVNEVGRARYHLGKLMTEKIIVKH